MLKMDIYALNTHALTLLRRRFVAYMVVDDSVSNMCRPCCLVSSPNSAVTPGSIATGGAPGNGGEEMVGFSVVVILSGVVQQ